VDETRFGLLNVSEARTEEREIPCRDRFAFQPSRDFCFLRSRPSRIARTL
jgi:hypothetical protein